VDQTHSNRVKEMLILPDRADTGLTDADLVLVVGQGAKTKETLDLLQTIAGAIGAALGASRPVVMNAWTDMERLVGASGAVLSPKICIAAGVSGSAVFTAGIKASEFIVAINTDPNAPIFQIAHVGIIGELVPTLLELERLILAEKGEKPHHKRHSGTEE
jgi:electron transfer flavoprotein alpha subunit